MAPSVQRLLRKAYRAAQSAFAARGIHVTVSRISARNTPELINRAIWRPLVSDDQWRSLYKTTQSATNGNGTDNIFRQCRFYSTFQMARYAARLPNLGEGQGRDPQQFAARQLSGTLVTGARRLPVDRIHKLPLFTIGSLKGASRQFR